MNTYRMVWSKTCQTREYKCIIDEILQTS